MDELRKIVIVIIFITGVGFAQTLKKQNLSNENLRLENLRNELSKLKTEYTQIEKEQKNSYQMLEKIRQKELVLNKLLIELAAEQKKLNADISGYEKQITSLTSEIVSLKKKYSTFVVWSYKKGEKSELLNFLKSNSLKGAYDSYKSFSFVTKAYENTISELKTKTDKLAKSKKQREISLELKRKVIISKKAEQEELDDSREEKEKLISKLSNDKNALDNEIRDKEKAQLKIKELIAELIRKETTRKTAKAKTSVNKFDYNGLKEIKSLKGKLAWPVNSGRIIRKFGKNRNSKTNTITLNYGIDIKTGKKSDIYCVADGIVSAVEWIPGYGSTIIVNHTSTYRTVYGNITGINVSVGERVKAGAKLGLTGKGIEGYTVHFELWKERDMKNPEVWLVKR